MIAFQSYQIKSSKQKSPTIETFFFSAISIFYLSNSKLAFLHTLSIIASQVLITYDRIEPEIKLITIINFRTPPSTIGFIYYLR